MSGCKLLLAGLLVALCRAQNNSQLPNLNREPPKPQVPADLADYFQLPDAGTRKFIGSYLPGFIPQANFDVVDPYHQQQALLKNPNLGVLTASNQNTNSFQLPGSSFDITNPSTWNFGGGSGSDTSAAQVPNELNIQPVNRPKGNSSISGIPNVFPALPKAPIPQAAQVHPSIPVRPEVPTGGLGPLSAGNNLGILTAGQSSPSALSLLQQNQGSAFGSQSSFPSPLQQQPSAFPQQVPGRENLLNQLLKSVGLESISQNVDLSPVNSILGLTPQQQSPQQGGLLSNVLYNALIDNNVQTQDNSNGTNVIDSKANAALIQNLLTQPTSPFCNPKPTPVEKFSVDSFTGKWYQVRAF